MPDRSNRSTPALEDFLAPYASLPRNSRGRLYAEKESGNRTSFQRDRDRVIHCSAFRRLKHKTQVFVYHEGDHYRTRLTHSIEVSQIARSICRSLRLNEDLAEALALAHDFGHTPFGHAGEDQMKVLMASYGGFDHNAQTLRLVTELESRYAAFPGLNLTWEMLEGLAKHNGPLLAQPIKSGETVSSLPYGVADYNQLHDLRLHTFAGLEAQVAAIADDVAYNNHDIDDGLRAGLFTLEQIAELPMVGEALADIRKAYPDAPLSVQNHELVRRLIGLMVRDITAETSRRLESLSPREADDIRGADRPMATFSETMRERDKELKSFLNDHMYRNYLVNRHASKAKRVVRDLFGLYIDEPECLPTEWQSRAGGPRTERTARVVSDFIAGMTDRYAIREHGKLFDLSVMPV